MQRPRDRQNHDNNSPSHRGRGRGRARWPRPPHGRGGGFHSPDLANVPTINQLAIGTPVSIVLKVDQPTGRQVQGTVADILTNGNHPRGIKVRLQDGRVGRVQRLATAEEAQTGSQGLRNLGRNGEPGPGSHTPGRGGGSSRLQMRYTDVRNDEYDAPPSNSYSLFDYMPGGATPVGVDEGFGEQPVSSAERANTGVSSCP
ncbi:hypothetical protein LTS18_007245, partial [Coniosporium uncinatum]